MDNPSSSAPAPGPAPAPQAGFFAAIRRTGLYRSDERWIGGVCGGLADRFGVDPLLVRGIVAVTVLLGGFGLVLYALGWALLPEQRDGRIHLEGLTLGHPDIALLGALVMLVVGLGRGSWAFGPDLRWVQAVFWVAAAVGVVVLVATAASHRRTSPRPPSPYGPFPGDGPVPPPPPVPPMPSYGPTASYGPASAAATGDGPAGRTTAAPSGPAPYVTSYAPAPAGQPTPAGAGYPPPSPYGPYTPGAYAGPVGRGPAYASGAYGPGPAAPAPAGTAAPVYPSPVRRTAGLPWVGSVVALGLLTLAGLLIAHRAGSFTGPIVATAAGVTVVLAGLATIVVGLRGRRSGGLTAVAIVAILVAGPAALGERTDWTAPGLSHAQQVSGSSTVTVTDRESASRGVRAGVGNTRIDLTAVPMDSSTLEVPLWLAVGNYTVVVPRGTAVTAAVDLGAGSVEWRLDGGNQQANGVGISQRTFANQAASSGTSQLHLRISMGTGDLSIIEEQA